MTYPASFSQAELDDIYWREVWRNAGQWPQVERRRQPRFKIYRTPYHKAEILQPRVKENA